MWYDIYIREIEKNKEISWKSKKNGGNKNDKE
jgi:hypothetical protein